MKPLPIFGHLNTIQTPLNEAIANDGDFEYAYHGVFLGRATMHYIRIRTSTGKQTTIGDQSSGKESVRRRMRTKIL